MTEEMWHVVPLNDYRDHETSHKCWCKPYEDDGLWIHNSMDRREEYEEGRKPS